jgi:hypothetical protein
MTKLTKILIITLAFIGGSVFVFAEENNSVISVIQKNSNLLKKDCTAEAKLCPDGTYVGRSGPDCSFAPCKENGDLKKDNKNILIQPIEPPKNIEGGIIKKEKILCTMEFDPVCGLVDTGIRCVTEPCPSKVEKTFANKCQAEVAGAEIIREGVCDNGMVKYLGPPIKVGSEESNSVVVEVDSEEKTMNGAGKEDEVVFKELLRAKNEDERKKILESRLAEVKNRENVKSGVMVLESNEKADAEKPETQEVDGVSKVEKRKKSIEKRSSEIFSKFDYFTNRLESILEKVKKEAEKVENFELTNTLETAEVSLAKALEQKTEG